MFEKINLRNTLAKLISFRDVLILLGLSSLGYGLYMVKPWLSFTICGGLAMFGGLLMKDN